MIEYKPIEKKVLKKITPTNNNRLELNKIITKLKATVKEKLNEYNEQASIELVGSTAKDTFLKNNLDIDLFLVFPRNKSNHTIAETTLQIGRNILHDTEECYAEHPYIRGIFLEHKIELVPCYQITKASEKISAVDRTPLHTRYIKKHLHEIQKNDVRLLKQFLTGIGCYGAEAEIQGFSGYLCELLILQYETFHKLIKQGSKWVDGIKLSLTDYPIPDFPDPLIFIDPVDKERNVAAAVSTNSFKRFKTACHEYDKKPKITFFFPNPTKPWNIEKIKHELINQKETYLGISFKKPHIINENLIPQIRKACTSITKASELEGFTIYDTQFHVDTKLDRIYIILKTDNQLLPESYTHTGPPIKLKKNTEEFIEKWTNHPDTINGPFQKEKRTYVTVKRPFRSINEFLKHNLTQLSLGKHLDPIISKEYKILSDEELIRSNLIVFWTQYLDDKKPWDR